MILVDSSVWIDFFNGRLTPAVERLRAYIETDDIAIGDLMLCEVLQGFRTEADAQRAERALTALIVLDLVTPERAILAAAQYRGLRRRGITIRKTIDLLIGAYCISTGTPLLQDDRDFLPVAEHLGLVLA
ncbi:PIN domain nuclease [Oceanibaculum sp.]|uniref:type II toxin-antitoxin system VapC family toxin n=1 Tax=Oceanibaculum sp. TaxID=1903597 RepID=UPI002584252E|nr:PIN domain nuclease [Oceanibaculum sp.]MCH2394090.1 PIN domain nuclease [Oceanibaculum sp.]